MQKIKILLLITVALCFLNSCGGVRIDMLGYNEEKDINAKFEKIIIAINENDMDAIKAFFSKNTLDEDDSLDENIEKLFTFIQGTIDSWEKRVGSSTSDSKDRGHRKREFSVSYDVNTGEQQYYFSLDYCSIDTKQPENVGLYLLLVVKNEDEEKIWDVDNKIIYDKTDDGKTVKIPRIGVYLPIE